MWETRNSDPSSAAPRLVMHVDMDAFFAAIEQRDHPEYRGLPVVVGAQPGTRGVVSTCSYEARKFGIRSAMPISEAFRRCPQAVYLRPDMQHYVAVSEQVMEILATVSPVVEAASIDEAYLDIGGLERLFGTPWEIAQQVKDRIRVRLQLTASVGIGPNRLIAKLASDYSKPDGLTVVSPDQVRKFLDPLPVSKLSGVGRVLGQKCLEAGVRTVADLRALDRSSLRELFGTQSGLILYQLCRGIASDHVGFEDSRKSISKEVTFEEDVRDQALLHDTLIRLASEVGALARANGVAGRVVTLKVRLAPFETHTRQHRIDAATNSDRRIFREGWRLYLESTLTGRPVRLIGIGVSELAEPSRRQPSLFDNQPDKEKKLFKAVDLIKSRHGDSSIRLGIDSTTKKAGVEVGTENQRNPRSR